MKVSDIMTVDVEMASPDDTVRTAAKLMADTGAGALPVCDGQLLVGMVTDRDITVRAVAAGKSPEQCAVRDVMTGGINYAMEDDDIQNVAQKMGEWQVHRLPVLNREKRVVGIVSLGDITLEAGDRKSTADAMQGIVQPTGKREQ